MLATITKAYKTTMHVAVISAASRSSFALIIIANNSLRGDIESVRSCFFHLLLACSFIVAVGVAIEGIEHVLSKGKPYLDEESGVFNATPLIEWHKKLERLGWLLVIVGVVGEGVFEGFTSSADSILQDFNNTLLAIATEQAGNAAKSAKTARGEAQAATVASGKVKQKADAVGKQAEMLEAKLGNTKKQLDAVDAKRAELEKSLTNLAICNAPRVIPDWSIGNKNKAETSIDPLKPFAQRPAIIDCCARLRDTRRAPLARPPRSWGCPSPLERTAATCSMTHGGKIPASGLLLPSGDNTFIVRNA